MLVNKYQAGAECPVCSRQAIRLGCLDQNQLRLKFKCKKCQLTFSVLVNRVAFLTAHESLADVMVSLKTPSDT